MIEVYFHIPNEHADVAVECGLKLSQWSSREVAVEGTVKKCITAFLNPRDDVDKFKSRDYRCIKLSLMPKYCYVADNHLYQLGEKFPEVMEMYEKSIVPIEQYAFGTYRLPECLITGTVVGDDIAVLDRRLDSPILFTNSEELYISNLIAGYKDTHEDFDDALLYHFYGALAGMGRLRKVESEEKGISLFVDERENRTYTVRIPDMSTY